MEGGNGVRAANVVTLYSKGKIPYYAAEILECAGVFARFI